MRAIDGIRVPDGVAVVTGEREVPPEPMPSVITPQWLDRRLQDFGMDITMTIVELLKGAGAGRGVEASHPVSGPEGYLSTEEAADYLGMSPKAIREGAARGDLPGHKYPRGSRRGRWRFRRRELDRFLKKPSKPHTLEMSVWD